MPAVVVSPPFAETLGKGTDEHRFGKRGAWVADDTYHGRTDRQTTSAPRG